jgi:hypothetical protein
MEIGGHGPPPIPNGRGKDHLLAEKEPYRLVVLDAVAFDWLWRIVESKYVQHRENVTHADAAEVAKRAVLAFREAAGTLTSAPPKKVWKRRIAKTATKP